MKLNKKAIIVVAVSLAIVFGLCGMLLLEKPDYIPISDVMNDLKGLRRKNCDRIELQYMDLTESGQGDYKTILVSEKDEIEKMQDMILQAFCRKDTLPVATGATNVSIKLLFEDAQETVMKTFAEGGIEYNGQYYSTNNELGTYFTKYVLSIKESSPE